MGQAKPKLIKRQSAKSHMRWYSQAIVLGHSHQSFEKDLDELLTTLLCKGRHLLSEHLRIYFSFDFSQSADCILPFLMKMPVKEDFLSSRIPGEVWLVFLGCQVGTHLLICTAGISLLSQSVNTWQKGYMYTNRCNLILQMLFLLYCQG